MWLQNIYRNGGTIVHTVHIRVGKYDEFLISGSTYMAVVSARCTYNVIAMCICVCLCV